MLPWQIQLQGRRNTFKECAQIWKRGCTRAHWLGCRSCAGPHVITAPIPNIPPTLRKRIRSCPNTRMQIQTQMQMPIKEKYSWKYKHKIIDAHNCPNLNCPAQKCALVQKYKWEWMQLQQIPDKWSSNSSKDILMFAPHKDTHFYSCYTANSKANGKMQIKYK